MGRTFHTDSRTWSNFQANELVKLTGVPMGRWPVYVVKELLDNAAAALEDNGKKSPLIKVTVCKDYVEVTDNGPGISDEVLENILDFDRFGGSNRHAKLPTRGAQGNAVMTLVGIASGWSNYIELRRPCGPSLSLEVRLDSVRQHVDIERIVISESKEMSSVKVPWPVLPWKARGSTIEEVCQIVRHFAWLNPHITFMMNLDGERAMVPADMEQRPAMPLRYEAGAASWFTREEFAARLAADVRARPSTTLSSWMREFAWSSVAQAGPQQTVAQATTTLNEAQFATYASKLRDQIVSSTPRGEAKRGRTTADEPGFSPVGQERLVEFMLAELGVDPDAKPQYHSVVGTHQDIPHLVEVCLIQMPDGCRQAPEPILAMNRTMLYGSPTFKALECREKVRGDYRTLSGDLGALCGFYQIDAGKTPAAVVIHATCPSPGYSGYGKQQFDTSWLAPPLSVCFEKVTLEVRKQRAGEARRSKAGNETKDTIRDTLFELLPDVLDRDTEGGTLPIMLRQLYYGVRKVWHLHHHKELQYATYCAYVDEYEEKVVKRMVCLKDPRGTLIEPHSGKELRLGTDAVNRYEPKKWEGHTIIVVEKEQFAHVLKAYGTARRYDAILIGSKGFAVESCREVLQKYKKLLGDMVTIIALHDADPAGYMIGHDLSTNLPRFGENVKINVIDVGLTIREAQEMELQDEPFDLKKPVWSMVKNMRQKMVNSGGFRRPLLDEEAWDMFMPNMLRHTEYPTWIDNPRGRRIELNAMAPRQFVTWLEGHLEANGCRKVHPPAEVVDAHLKNARENMVKNEVGKHLMRILGDDAVHDILGEIGVPSFDLASVLEMKPEQSWAYLTERAGQTGVDIGPIIERVLARRLRA